ncbi:LARGE xylosyl- and glucuronyltransferase 2-like isoform X2 [Stegodyphus dumicola]|uniref:LARGE xylosyl- and glucuronyltransferase 2-like isoform X2 n=1 Tax=Stegodyphus dumicola TaxID=202533 RepID=UPI0015B1643D|nr:LARGE xylosyl- and glucuronyltransferase 2-like isoform X2 [Stegodyphus dumicola]
MMRSTAKWKGAFRGTNAFQIILCVILFHSLASILIIYIHLVWFFSEEEKIWKKPDETAEKGSLIGWNMKSVLNVLSSKVISNNEISLLGWWMDHAKWDTDIRCSNQRWTMCSKGFSSTCKVDGIRAIYQYITFAKESHVTGFDLSVTATADQLEPQAIGASFGALALVKLADGNIENVQIQFPSNIEPLTTQSISYSGTPFINSVVVMLMCYGYTGSIHFTDPVLMPHVSFPLATTLVEKCPVKSPTFQYDSNIVKKEELLKASHKSAKDQFNQVTLVTQVSMDRLSTLERSLHMWDGPVSLVIYVATKHSEKLEYEWQRLYIQKKLKNLKLLSSSHVTLAFGNSFNDDYPINALRNIAIRKVKTKYMLLLDADFQPSPDFQQKFLTSLKHVDFSLKTAFVVPAFEYMELPQKSDNAPQTKEELLQLLHREEPFILPFRISESSESHRITDYWKWYRADKPYVLNTFCDKYEPYIVLHKSSSVPLYDERFTGYGMNKVTHITELFAANYTFIVLPDIWVLHVPHKISNFAVEFLQNAHQRLKNRMERFEFIADIMNTYKMGNCKQLH